MDLQQHGSQLRVFGFGFGTERLLGQRHSKLLRDRPHRLRKSNVLNFLNEAEDIARSLTAKAVVKLPRCMHRERWRLLLVKWA